MNSPLADTILQWNVSQCLDKELYHDSMTTIPHQFQDMPHWSGSFDVHIHDEMRESLRKVFEIFLKTPTQFNFDNPPNEPPRRPTFRTISCRAAIDRNSFEGSIVIFVESGSIELDTESLKRTKHFLAEMTKEMDERRSLLGNVALRFYNGDLQNEFMSAKGAGWTLYILDGLSRPAQVWFL